MTNLVKVAYVGKKPHAFDNISHSGKSWNGYGDVQSVTEQQAKQLLNHPDQWALVNEADRKAVEAPVVIHGTDEHGVAVTIEQSDLKKPLEKMSKAELMALANKTWGKSLDQTLSKKYMIDQIEEWQRDLDE